MAKIEQSIDVEVPVRTAYNQLTQFEDYPRFMDSVREIKQDDAAHLHWRAEKGGKEIEWDSEITEQVPDKVIAWRNTSGAKNIGRVVFQTTSADRTRVTISIDTDEAATGEIGKASKQRLERDLQKFKAFIEAEGVETGAWRGAIEGGEEVSSQRQSNAIGQNGHSSSSNGNGTNFGARNVAQVQLNTDDAQGRQPRQPAGQSSFKSEANMANQGGSMQFSGEVNQSRSSAQQPTSSPLAQAWAQPARIMSQMSSAFGQMPARMLEQEANLLQNSFVSPQAWLPTVLNVWEEPFVMLRKISEEMDQFFGKVAQRPIGKISQGHGSSGITQRSWTPDVEISQRGNEIVICADLPGLGRDDVQLQVHEDKLTIEGERREESASHTAQGYHRTERSYGRFYRAIPLPEGVDGHAAQAKMRDGVLEIVVPIHNQQRHGTRLEIQEAQEGDLREQRELQEVRQQREQYANQQRNQPQHDRQQNAQQSAQKNDQQIGQPDSQQREHQSNQQHDLQASTQRDPSPDSQRQSGASARVEAKV